MPFLLFIRSFLYKEVFWIYTIGVLLEIAFLALIYYAILRVVKRREVRAFIFVSIGIWIFQLVIVPFLGLSLLSNLAQLLHTGVVVTLGVICFDDIKRWLLSLRLPGQRHTAHRTPKNQLSGFSGRIPQHAIRELTSAIDRMKQTRTGALIVIPDQDDASMYMQDEIDIHGIVTEELLLSIFNPKSPLHDGATVINKDRVVSARNILPVTKDESKTDYGTRHRAAIGLSETCDAMVLVVSEERGALSICHGGSIRTVDDNNWQEELRSWLV